MTGSKARYDPFGTMTTAPATNPSVSNHGFTGHRHNNTGTNDLGLIYMNARYYMPEIGRFVSPDTIVPEPGNPQSYNRYSYTLNNPVKYVDPSGHCAQSDDACWALADELYRLYGWRIVGVWQQQDLMLFLKVGDAIAGWFKMNGGEDGIGRMRGILGGVTFKHGDLIGSVFVPGNHHVRGSNVYLLPRFNLGSVVHELGHVLDNKLGFGSPIGSALFGGGPADDMASMLGADPGLNWLRSGQIGYKTPEEQIDPNAYSKYATTGPSEDFAEAFRLAVLSSSDFQSHNPVRADFMSNLAVSLVTSQSEFVGASIYLSQRIVPVAAPSPPSQ